MITNKDFKDDNHTIVNMNVEGMRGYIPNIDIPNNKEKLNKKESLSFVISAIYASLVVVLLFSAVIILFVLFVLKVWLKV